MTDEQVVELRELVADVLGLDAAAISDDSGPGIEPAWDSLAHLSIVTAVERSFSVRFSMEEIRSIGNFGALAEAVALRLA